MADQADIRREILGSLASPNSDGRFGEQYLATAVGRATGATEGQVWEAIWSLVADRLVFLDADGQRSSTENWQWRLSAIGWKAAYGGHWEPRDPEGYLRRLRAHIPDLDPVALRYVEEALRAFNARCYLATSVMLGVASEQVFNELAASFVRSEHAEGSHLDKLLMNPRSTYVARFQEFRKRIEPRRPSLPDDLADVLTLDAVSNLLRITRNSAGHPTGQSIDEDTARTHLQMAAVYLRRMTELTTHLDSNAASN